jgi:acetyl-CoA C-acetyltransferase
VASQISDASAAMLIASEQAVKDHGLKPRARIHHLSVRADDPIWMLTAPRSRPPVTRSKAGMTLDDIDLVEINEAFASVVLAWLRRTSTCPTTPRSTSTAGPLPWVTRSAPPARA